MDASVEHRTIRKAVTRLLPLLLAAYICAYINRVNIGFAFSMQEDLALSAAIFGLGAGLFFIGYFLFEIPSNLMMVRVGARRWIARIILSWGLLSMAMSLVQGVNSFMAVRFLLGVAQAGFFPGVILYMTFWFPAAYRARLVAWFMIAIPISLAVTGPISNLIVESMGGLAGLRDWQWLFIVQATPTVILAFVVLKLLPDKPKDAKWLTAEESHWLQSRIDTERAQIETTHKPRSVFRSVTDARTLVLAFIYFANTTSSYGVGFFLPQIIKGLGSTASAANYLSTIPFLAGAVGILIFGQISDRFRAHRRLILIVAFLITAIGMAGAGAIGATYASLVLIGVSVFGTYGGKAPFWPLPGMFLTGAAAAGGIAFINSIGNVGGFVGPYLLGWVRDATGSYTAGLYVLGGLAFAGAIATLLLRTPSDIEPEKASVPDAASAR
jgi:ACS family tartrate transporter-like MFS transporter